MRHYLVLSDLHLCDVEAHSDGWKAYKHPRYHADEPFCQTLETFAERGTSDDERVLVLNGDIFDFDLVTLTPSDAPWPVNHRERSRGLRPTARKSAWKLQRILADHPRWLEGLSRFVAAGNSVVYVVGNHDSELNFPEVAEALFVGLEEAARRQGLRIERKQLRIEPWFYYVPGELYVEHGQQYDYYTSFRYLLHPFVKPQRSKPAFIALPMGNLSNRYLMSQMGFFNPHASDYILNVFRYLSHWLHHYAFSLQRHLAVAWIFGSLAVLGRLFFIKGCLQKDPPDYPKLLEAYAAARALPLAQVHALDALKQPPITNRLFRLIREFWIDRLALAVLMTSGTVTLALVPIPLWIKLMVPLSSFPLLFLIYEWAAHGESIFHIEQSLPRFAAEIAQIFPVQLVIFGHTHKPELLPLGRGVSYVNTGTWAPVWERGNHNVLAAGYRNVLEASFGEKQKLSALRFSSLLAVSQSERHVAPETPA